MFFRLFQHYKDDFDREMQMQRAGVTYAALKARAQRDETWL